MLVKRVSNRDVIITQKNNASYIIRRKLQKIAYDIFGPVIMTKVYYKMIMGKKLDLKNPRTFTEKICWYKLYFCPGNRLVVQCADKYRMREYLDNKNLGEMSTKLLFAHDIPDQIVWDNLPKKFVLKCSHGCGYNIICLNKESLDKKKSEKLMTKWLTDDFGKYNCEPHYEKGKRRIICEEYIDSNDRMPADYKVHCFNGNPKVIQYCSDRESNDAQYEYYTMRGERLPWGMEPIGDALDVSEEVLSQINETSSIIAPDFPYVRIDYYIIDNELRIGELTFSPSAGYKPDLADGRGDDELGAYFDLSQIEKYY